MLGGRGADSVRHVVYKLSQGGVEYHTVEMNS